MVRVAAVGSFSRLHSIPRECLFPHSSSQSVVDGHLPCFQFRDIMNAAAVSILFPIAIKFTILIDFFRAVLGSQQDGAESTEIFHMLSAPRHTHTEPPPVSTSCTSLGHSLQSIKSH